MAVSITWSLTNNGASITSADHGDSTNGDNTTAVEIFLRHDGVNEITSCGFFCQQKSGTYTGAANAAADFSELLAWGDAATANGFGGFQINMDKEGTYSGGATWGMSESQKSSSDGLKFTVRTGVGDSNSNAVTLAEEMSTGMSSDGVIPAGVTDIGFQARVKIPTDEDTAGIRQFDQVLKYIYTS